MNVRPVFSSPAERAWFHPPAKIDDIHYLDGRMMQHFSDPAQWTNCRSVHGAIDRVEQSQAEVGCRDYEVPASRELELYLFIRAVLSEPDGYLQVAVKNIDDSVTVIRSVGPRKAGRLNTELRYFRSCDEPGKKWPEVRFPDAQTSHDERADLTRLLFPGSEAFFAELTDRPYPLPAPDYDCSPNDDDVSLMSVTRSDIDAASRDLTPDEDDASLMSIVPLDIDAITHDSASDEDVVSSVSTARPRHRRDRIPVRSAVNGLGTRSAKQHINQITDRGSAERDETRRPSGCPP